MCITSPLERKVMEQALAALEWADERLDSVSIPNAITALRQCIEQADTVTLTQTNVGIGERATEAYEAAHGITGESK